MIEELRGRIHNSAYYDHYRMRRSLLKNGMVCMKEVSEASWVIYGICLYTSDDAKGCSVENRGFVILMVMFLVIGVLKFVLLLAILGIMIYISIANKIKKRKQRNASVRVLQSISKIRYSSISENINNTEDECIICYMEYNDEDTVTKLKCNEKHIFHTSCIQEWIRQGKNSCPICREPINSSIEL